uniref:Uncharacterized protein n=1 Tax=Anguilla anguilla TaxID=7936 RepID=A0A0E9WCV2_ANGAN
MTANDASEASLSVTSKSIST